MLRHFRHGCHQCADDAASLVVDNDGPAKVGSKHPLHQKAAEAATRWRSNQRAAGFSPGPYELVSLLAFPQRPINLYPAPVLREGAILHGICTKLIDSESQCKGLFGR